MDQAAPISEEQPRQAQRSGPKGIGGWLLLPLIHLFVLLVVILLALFANISDTVLSLALDFPGTGALDFRAGIFSRLVFPALLLGLLGLNIICIVRFSEKKQELPTLIISLYCALVIFDLLRMLSFADFDLRNSPYNAGFLPVAPFYYNLGWTLYFMHSKRVKATFVS